MKTLLIGLVIVFLSMAMLVVLGCSLPSKEEMARNRREAERKRQAHLAKIEKIKCAPEKFNKKYSPELSGGAGEGEAFFITTVASSWTSSAATEGSAKSSETSGCRKKTKKSSFYLQQQEFVAVTIDNLSEQIAQGGGPHLQSLSALLGCPASDYPVLADMARRDFGRLFPSADIEPGEFLARLKDDIAHDPRLAVRCVYV